MNKKVQLVLGSGAARGVTQIGVIEMLLQDGYEIVEVAGCSMGAVVGGMFCSGHLAEYRDWLLKLNRNDVYRLFDFAFSRKGLVKGDRIFGIMQQMGEQKIENLPIPFTAVATDMLSHSEVYFKSGNLYAALRASTGIPGIFTPVADDKYLFVDGGVLNPVPVNLIQRKSDAIIVVVNLNGAFSNSVERDMRPEPELVKHDILSRMRNYFLSQEKGTTKTKEVPRSDFSIFELLIASYHSTQDRLVEMTLTAYPPDVLIEIPRNVCSEFEFYRTAELIEFGKKAYAKAMGKFNGEYAKPV
jgi:NTE family protein